MSLDVVVLQSEQLCISDIQSTLQVDQKPWLRDLYILFINLYKEVPNHSLTLVRQNVELPLDEDYASNVSNEELLVDVDLYIFLEVYHQDVVESGKDGDLLVYVKNRVDRLDLELVSELYKRLMLACFKV